MTNQPQPDPLQNLTVGNGDVEPTLSRRHALAAGAAGLALALTESSNSQAEAQEVQALGTYKSPGPLKIEKIEAFWFHDGSDTGKNFPRAFVRVYTDQGVVGEAYTFFWHSFDGVMDIILKDIAPLLVGMDAMEVERCWQEMWKVLDRHFARGVGSSILAQFTRAQAAVDAAIWDTVGKAFDAPLYKMWGAYTNRLPAISFDQRYRHPGANYDPEGFADHMREVAEMGFGGVKLKPGRPPFTPKEDAEWVRIVREALGPDFLIQADANLRWNVDEAIDFGLRVQDLDLRWLEEPCRTRREMARVRAATGLPICAGQSELTIDGARYLMTEDAIDVCNYDVGYAGGPTAWRKVYGLAAAFGVEMSVHQQPQIATNLMAATPHAEKHGVEFYMPDVDPWFNKMITNQNPVKDGYYTLPDGPGFGFQYDEDFLNKYRVDSI